MRSRPSLLTPPGARVLQMDELLRRCSCNGGSKDKGQAAWNLCALLFTAKTATSPMYSALANQFDGKIAFGEVSGQSCDLISSRASTNCIPDACEIALDRQQMLPMSKLGLAVPNLNLWSVTFECSIWREVAVVAPMLMTTWSPCEPVITRMLLLCFVSARGCY